jgi:hypothetical protein
VNAFIAVGFTKRDVLDVATTPTPSSIGSAERVELARGIVKGRLRIAVQHRER